MKKNFDAWKRDLLKLFKGKAFMIPGNDWLFSRFQAGFSVETVAMEIRSIRR
jgi:hypothetical protein